LLFTWSKLGQELRFFIDRSVLEVTVVWD